MKYSLLLLFLGFFAISKADVTREMYDSITSLISGSLPYPEIWWEERSTCLSNLSPSLQPALEAAWQGMVDYWQTRGAPDDPWPECKDSKSSLADPRSGWFESNCTRQPGIDMDIWEPCNYASNLAYDRLVLELCLQSNWTFPQSTVDKIAEAFAIMTFGSAFMHGSNTRLGGNQDTTSNDLFVYIVYQAGVSNIPYNPVIHDLAYQPRQRSGEAMVDIWLDMFATKPVSEWKEFMETNTDLPSIKTTFAGMFGYILTLTLDPEVVDTLAPSLMESFGMNEKDVTFFMEGYLPVVRNATYGTWLGLRDRISLSTNTLATVGKLLYAFLWQEGVFDLGGLNLTPEANKMGAEFLPVLNEYANNLTSWDLLVDDIQMGGGYPGSDWCNRLIPHAKWHVQTAASLSDVTRLMDQVFRLIEENQPEY